MRGVPDVSYNAALISSILIYESFDPTVPPGYTPIGGTSAATPQWAAIDAIANQADGNLGFLTPRLYQVYDNKAAYALAFHDITAGNNTSDGSRVTPPGRAGMRPPDWVHPMSTTWSRRWLPQRPGRRPRPGRLTPGRPERPVTLSWEGSKVTVALRAAPSTPSRATAVG
jgi:hypothetical protein